MIFVKKMSLIAQWNYPLAAQIIELKITVEQWRGKAAPVHPQRSEAQAHEDLIIADERPMVPPKLD